MEILGESLDTLRATRTSAKWRVYPPDVLPVWVAEMDARPCPEVVDAVTDALRRGDTGYGFARDYIAAFAGFARRRWGWEVDESRALEVPDVMIGIEELISSNTGPDAAVVFGPPCYDSFPGFVAQARRRPVLAPLDDRFRLDEESLTRAFADAGRGAVYILCNPQNPTGTVHTRDELSMLARLADEYDVLVISDEIHAPLVRPGVEFTPYGSVSDRGVSVVSASKSFNLAGIKTAIAVPGAATDAVARLDPVVTHGAHHLAMIAETTAYTRGEAWLDRLLGEIDERRALLTSLLADAVPAVRVTPADATYLAWLDLGGLGLADPVRAFLDRGRVALARGDRYAADAVQWGRFNLATSPEVIEEAVRRMAATVSDRTD